MDKSDAIVENIKSVCELAAAPLLHVANNGPEKVHVFLFDTTELVEDYLSNDIRNSVRFKERFDTLKSITGPVLYIFEVISETEGHKILTAATTYKGDRAMPAFRASTDVSSKTLYVGKVKRNFWGRVIQHLGYYKVPATQGLQLFHWTRELPIKIKLTAYEFRVEMEEIMPLIENATAKKLKPIIGKHK